MCCVLILHLSESEDFTNAMVGGWTAWTFWVKYPTLSIIHIHNNYNNQHNTTQPIQRIQTPHNAVHLTVTVIVGEG